MATQETIHLSEPHRPHQHAIDAFKAVESDIKKGIIKSRHHWDKHEPKMWERATGISDGSLIDFNVERDLVLVRSGSISYGTALFGKIRLPHISDGYVHVRVHDPNHTGDHKDVLFHSVHTEEGPRNADGHHAWWRAIFSEDSPLEFFNE